MTEKNRDMIKIGVLHPGNMGISVAASAQNSGNEVYWASQGRSSQTRERAEIWTRTPSHQSGAYASASESRRPALRSSTAASSAARPGNPVARGSISLGQTPTSPPPVFQPAPWRPV
jgi:hypothetical protein